MSADLHRIRSTVSPGRYLLVRPAVDRNTREVRAGEVSVQITDRNNASACYVPTEQLAAAVCAAVPATEISTLEELQALPAECLLRGGKPGYGPSYVVTVDLGDGVVMYEEVGANLTLTPHEVLEEHAPLTLLHRPAVVR